MSTRNQYDAGKTWTPSEATTVDALLRYASTKGSWRSGKPKPWREDQSLEYRGAGGMEVHGDRHQVIAIGNVTNLTGHRRMVVDGNMSVSVGCDFNIQQAEDESVRSTDELRVRGNMTWQVAKNKMIFGTGTVDRVWHGPVARVTGMEGVICGGAFERVYASLMFTVNALRMADVFGGAVGATGARVNISRTSYRSSDGHMGWMGSAYVRNMVSVVEPAMGDHSTLVSVASKAGRAASVAQKIAFTIMPLFGMLYGVGMAFYLAIVGLVWLISAIVGKLAGTAWRASPFQIFGTRLMPRVRTRTVAGAEVAIRSSEVIL